MAQAAQRRARVAIPRDADPYPPDEAIDAQDAESAQRLVEKIGKASLS